MGAAQFYIDNETTIGWIQLDKEDKETIVEIMRKDLKKYIEQVKNRK